MTRILPGLHEGHAPIHLHEAFSSALDAYEGWIPGADEPTVAHEAREVPISAVFGRMRTCRDLLPGRILADVADILGDARAGAFGDRPTYGDAAVVLRALCVERLRELPAGALRPSGPGHKPAGV